MEFLNQLWMPIVVSALFVWIASAVVHMVLPIHKGDWKALPDESKVSAALEGTPAGQYMMPYIPMADMKNPESMERFKRGPNGTIVIWEGPVNMGRNLFLTFLFYLVVGVFVAYITWHALQPGEMYLHVFRIAGASAFLAHGFGWMPQMIWFGGSSRSFWAYLFDSVVYALITAGTFGWLWAK